MKRGTTKMAAACSAALTILAAGILGTGLIRAPRQQPGTPAPGQFTDYIDDATGTVTRAFPGSALSYNFLQAGPNGGGRDVVALLTPIHEFELRDEDDEISLPSGDVVISRPVIRPSRDSYTISFRFYIPPEVLPAKFRPLVNARTAAGHGPVHQLMDMFAPTLLAGEGDGISGIISDTFLPNTNLNGGESLPRTLGQDAEYERYKAWYQREVQREALSEANMEQLERKLIGQTITTGEQCSDPAIARARDYVRRARELAEDEIRFGKLTRAQQAARSAEAGELAARRASINSELRGGRTFTPLSSGSSSSSSAGASVASRSGTAVRVAADAATVAALALKLARIQSDSERWKERLKDLKDCAENPTNPLTKRAATEDPNYRRATLDPIATAGLEEAFVTNARRVAATTNSGASTAFKLAGATAVELIGEVEDALLERTMEQTLEQLEVCVAKCRKRTLNVDFVFVYSQEGASWKRTANITGGATLLLAASGDGYEGAGKASYKATSHTTNVCGIPGNVEDETVTGTLAMEGKAYFSTNNNRTGGLAVGKRERTVLEILTTTGTLKGTGSRGDCDGKVTATNTTYQDHIFDCHFYDVDLKVGGVFETDKHRQPELGRCTVTIRPQR